MPGAAASNVSTGCVAIVFHARVGVPKLSLAFWPIAAAVSDGLLATVENRPLRGGKVAEP